MKWYEVTIDGESCKVSAEDESAAVVAGKSELGKAYAKRPVVCPCSPPKPYATSEAASVPLTDEEKAKAKAEVRARKARARAEAKAKTKAESEAKENAEGSEGESS